MIGKYFLWKWVGIMLWRNSNTMLKPSEWMKKLLARRIEIKIVLQFNFFTWLCILALKEERNFFLTTEIYLVIFIRLKYHGWLSGFFTWCFIFPSENVPLINVIAKYIYHNNDPKLATLGVIALRKICVVSIFFVSHSVDPAFHNTF